MSTKTDPVLNALKKASKGLSYTSETDAPLEPFSLPEAGELTRGHLRQLAGADQDATVEETTLESFFRAVPPEDQAKFQALTKTLQGQLSGIKVYKVGDEPERQALIVGKTKDGRWAGLKTTIVET
jgi:histidine triad (HIT) family protein